MLKIRTITKWLSIAFAGFITLFLLLAILLYIPPVQNFVVKQVTQSLSEPTGMKVSIQKVRLVFPLDLSVDHILVTEQNDTVVDAQSLKLDVKLWPLFQGRADIDGLTLRNVRLNTLSYIADTQVQGTAGVLAASSHGVDWVKEMIKLNQVRLEDANLYITLSDTAQKDTTSTPVNWNISLDDADILRSSIHLSMPGDSMRIFSHINQLSLHNGQFDLGNSYYAFKNLDIRKSKLGYDFPFEPTTEGLDINHLTLNQINLAIDTLSYNAKGQLNLELREATTREKCGLHLQSLKGRIYMDNDKLYIPNLQFKTPYSEATGHIDIDFRSFTAGQGGSFMTMLDANLGAEDLRLIGMSYVDESYFKNFPNKPSVLKAHIKGNMDHMVVQELTARIPQVMKLEAKGVATNLAGQNRQGHFDFNLNTYNLTLLRGIMAQTTGPGISIPDSIFAHGDLGFKGDTYDTQLAMTCRPGTLKATAQLNPTLETYKIEANINTFPLASFLTDMPLGALTGQLRASGTGFDMTSMRTQLVGQAQIEQFNYDKYDLSGIKLEADLKQGIAEARLRADNELIEAEGRANAILSKQKYDVQLNTLISRLDMKQLGVSADTFYLGTDLNISAQCNTNFKEFKIEGGARHNYFSTSIKSTMGKDILFNFNTDKDTTTAHIKAGDLTLNLGAKGNLDLLLKQIDEFGNELISQTERKILDQNVLKQKMPTLALNLEIGRRNPLYNIVRLQGYDFSGANLRLTSDPTKGLSSKGYLGRMNLGGLLLDTINTYIKHDSTGVQLFARVKNNKKNITPLEMVMKSYFLEDGGGIRLIYLDKNKQRGLDLEVQATLKNGGLNIHFSPDDPILAYRKIQINKNNYIFLTKDNAINADVKMLADDGTGLQLYGQKQDSINDLTLSVHQINLKELSDVIPYLPSLQGMLSGDIHMTNDMANQKFTAMASLNSNNFGYEDVSFGDLGIDAIYMPEAGGKHQVSAFVNSNGNDVLDFNGVYYNKNEGYISGDAHMTQFPLQMLNGFLVGTDVALRGNAQGSLKVEGPLSQPTLNGTLDLDESHIYSDVYGVDFRAEERAIEIKDSRILFDQYNLYSTGKNPLVLNGYFDMSNFENMRMDFKMRARDFELINTRKKAQSMVFGKVYTNFYGILKGTTDNLTIRGSLDVLNRTDMTYVLKDSPLSVDDRLNDLVEFVSFDDSTKVLQSKPAPEGSFDLTLNIAINDAAQFHCTLSEDGQSYVNLEGGGDLTLRMTQQGEMRMTGRFTANNGEMKYALPVIPLKKFHLVQGSYVEFTGDVMNPTLNIAAKERTKAVVTENDKQRSVSFDVGVSITQPLNNMGLEFTIESPEDLAVQNELTAMSKEQRGKAAVTLMATGMYMTDESMMSGSGFKANNALNAFLQSEIQNIAGSALKTIDINFGVENNTSQTGSTTTDYSFQFAKRFWNNRISVIVGGKVSTGADAQNDAESFINNISVEYRLDQSATRYIRLFYDRNSIDPLEGELTKTGAGLVLRRKTNKLGELFIFKKKKENKKYGAHS